jgi:Replication-relaxation
MSAWTPYQLRELLGRLTPRDLLILTDLERFRLLSTNHIRRLQFVDGHATQLAATRGAVRVLGRLEAGGFISRLTRRVGGPLRGSTATVWQLSATGERVLRARRGDATRRRFDEPSPFFTRHTLAVSELGVRVIERSREPDVTLLELLPEPASWRSFTNALGGVSWVRPDLLVVTADQVSETHTWVEVDLGTEHLPTVLRKCAVYQRYFRTGIEQARREVFPLIAWITSDAHRASRIRAAIAADRSLDPDLFVVTTNDDVMEVLAPPDASTTALTTT